MAKLKCPEGRRVVVFELNGKPVVVHRGGEGGSCNHGFPNIAGRSFPASQILKGWHRDGVSLERETAAEDLVKQKGMRTVTKSQKRALRTRTRTIGAFR